MAKPPTALQRRIIAAADPVTGLITGSEHQIAGLVRNRLAFRHPRPPHDHFLTPAGHRIRDELLRPEDPGPVSEPGTAPATGSGSGSVSEPAPAADRGVFAARTGTEPAESIPVGADPAARAREVHSAWLGLLEMRRMTNRDGSTALPCGWERAHLVRSAALALEAAGCPPGADGYRVTGTVQPEAVAVHAPTEHLDPCADALGRAGWQVSAHTEPRTRARYLLASPRRV